MAGLLSFKPDKPLLKPGSKNHNAVRRIVGMLMNKFKLGMPAASRHSRPKRSLCRFISEGDKLSGSQYRCISVVISQDGKGFVDCLIFRKAVPYPSLLVIISGYDLILQYWLNVASEKLEIVILL